MRNIKTREGYEYWDKLCAIPNHAFLFSSDGKRIIATPGMGTWIDQHAAQEVVDAAQDEINALRREMAALKRDCKELLAIKSQFRNYRDTMRQMFDTGELVCKGGNKESS
mgnify:CR=1 FL=1